MSVRKISQNWPQICIWFKIRYRGLLFLIDICKARSFDDGPAAQTVIAVIENGNLTLSDCFMRLVKRNVHRVARPLLAHRNGDGGHAMADLHARAEAFMRKGGGWGFIAPYPREIVRGDTGGEQRRMATKYKKSSVTSSEHRSKDDKRGRGTNSGGAT